MMLIDFDAARSVDFNWLVELVYVGDPITGTGDVISMQVRAYAGASSALLQIDTIPYTDVDNGDGTRTLTIEPFLSQSVLAAAPSFPSINGLGQGVHEIKILHALDGSRDRLAVGPFTLAAGINTL